MNIEAVSIHELLLALQRHAVVVGSAARGNSFKDIDILIPERKWKKTKLLFDPLHPYSAYPMNAKTSDTVVPVEVFVVWYGPMYEDIPGEEVVERELFGVKMRAWPGETR